MHDMSLIIALDDVTRVCTVMSLLLNQIIVSLQSLKLAILSACNLVDTVGCLGLVSKPNPGPYHTQEYIQ